jgi:hypothetical protein
MRFTLQGIFAAAALALLSANTYAYQVTISGSGAYDGQWNVTTVSGLTADLVGPITSQVWYGNSPLASTFAAALGGGLGYPNFTGGGGNASPYFTYFQNGLGAAAGAIFYENTQSVGGLVGFGSGVFAVASRVPEPGTCALLGLGLAALALSRRRKAN